MASECHVRGTRAHDRRYRPDVARPPDVADLVARARRGEHRAVARLISLVETDAAGGPAVLREVAAALAPHTGRARLSYERAEYLFKRATGHTLRSLRAPAAGDGR